MHVILSSQMLNSATEREQKRASAADERREHSPWHSLSDRTCCMPQAALFSLPESTATMAAAPFQRD